ncbi:MAG: hypothetical protein QOE77_1964 [Blastocatellia bacterium]|nr:hypothetical protein [Blastocatellia bacterium]
MVAPAFPESDCGMTKTVTASGRRTARRLCIVTDLPILLQAKSTQHRPETAKPILVSLRMGLLKITETATGEIVIEFEPP